MRKEVKKTGLPSLVTQRAANRFRSLCRFGESLRKDYLMDSVQTVASVPVRIKKQPVHPVTAAIVVQITQTRLCTGYFAVRSIPVRVKMQPINTITDPVTVQIALAGIFRDIYYSQIAGYVGGLIHGLVEVDKIIIGSFPGVVSA